MAVSIYRLGYKKLSQVIFEWQAADRASLLALFMVMEVSLHWLWCLFVWLRRDSLNAYVHVNFLYPLWIGITLVGLFLWWMVGHLSQMRDDDKVLNRWQVVLMVPYTLYIAVVIIMMGYSSLFAGVSLVGGAMLGMMLVKRRYVWRLFLVQIALILLAIISPYFGINLPNLRQLTVIYPLLDTHTYLTYNEVMAIENAMAASIFKNDTLGWDNVSILQRSSTFFWRSTHLYLTLPKAIFIVYIFRTLLVILDDSKKEILTHANQDALTHLYNRRCGLTHMQRALLAVTEKQNISVILLDLDWFKNINDNFGHEVGDQVLREMAQTLLRSLQKDAIVSRYGGEEFLIVLPNTSHHDALLVAEKLRLDIIKHVIKVDENIRFEITASLGLYTLDYDELRDIIKEFQPDTATMDKLLPRSHSAKDQRKKHQNMKQLNAQQDLLFNDICQYLIGIADEALYKAKHQGRNQTVSANELVAAGHLIKPSK